MATDKKGKMEPTDVCICMHTAMRKLCDSPQTTAFYNLVHVVQSLRGKLNPWLLWGELVVQELDRGKPPAAAVHYAMLRMEDEFLKRRNKLEAEGMKVPPGDTHAMYAMARMSELFEKDDWEAVAGYLAG